MGLPVTHDLLSALRYLKLQGPAEHCVRLIQALHLVNTVARPLLRLSLHFSDHDGVSVGFTHAIEQALRGSLHELSILHYRHTIKPASLVPPMECPNLKHLPVRVDAKERTLASADIRSRPIEIWPNLSSQVPWVDEEG